MSVIEDKSGLRREFDAELEKLINRCSMEKNSNTPDFILAEYLTMCLHAFDKATQRRHEWYKEIDRLNNFICEDGVKLEKLRDEIEKLNADNENMREALKKCIELCVCQTESEMFIDQAKEALQEGAE